MVEVVCDDCQAVQTTSDYEDPACDECGSRSLTVRTGYASEPTSRRDHISFP